MKTAVFYENLWEGAQAAGRTVEDVLTQMHAEGMDKLYLSVDSWKRDREMLRPVLEKLGMPVAGMHGFCDFPREPDTAYYREMIDLAAEAGAENLLFVPGMYSTGNTVQDLDHMIAGMRKAVEYGHSKGLPILMEDFDGVFAPYNCAAGLRYFFERVPGLGCAFDTGNFIFFREDELQAFDLFADKIETLHLKDRTAEKRNEGDSPFLCADGRPVYVCGTGTGDIRMAEILERLKKRNFTGNLVIELYCVDPRHVLETAADSLRWLKARI